MWLTSETSSLDDGSLVLGDGKCGNAGGNFSGQKALVLVGGSGRGPSYE
jgi:hypothetical protein